MNTDSPPATILVIDDHIALAQGFAQALTIAGYTVLVAHDASSALDQAHRHHPDGIILDFQMPFVNGSGFLYRLRSSAALRDTPVLVVTGQSLTSEVGMELRELDANVLHKPISMADLVARTRSLLAVRNARASGGGNAIGRIG